MLMRFDPFRDFDRLTEAVLGSPRAPSMPMDAFRHGDHFVIHFDVPGVDPSTIDLTVEKNVLSVTAERTWQPVDGDEVIASERRHGRFTRQLMLGEALDVDHIEASYDAGVLTLTIPVAEEAKPRKVQVTSGGEQRAIEASAVSA